jgi:hypothetical protein
MKRGPAVRRALIPTEFSARGQGFPLVATLDSVSVAPPTSRMSSVPDTRPGAKTTGTPPPVLRGACPGLSPRKLRRLPAQHDFRDIPNSKGHRDSRPKWRRIPPPPPTSTRPTPRDHKIRLATRIPIRARRQLAPSTWVESAMEHCTAASSVRRTDAVLFGVGTRWPPKSCRAPPDPHDLRPRNPPRRAAERSRTTGRPARSPGGTPQRRHSLVRDHRSRLTAPSPLPARPPTGVRSEMA